MKYLPGEGWVLDAGSGLGTFSLLMAEAKNRRVIGVELDERKVEVARYRARGVENVDFIAGDIMEVSFNREFDAVTCVDLLHHLQDTNYAAVFAKMHQLLKTGGLLLIKEVDTKPFYKYAWNYIHDVIMTRSFKVRFIPKERVIKDLRRANFRVRRCEDISNILYPHYLLVCEALPAGEL